MNMIKNANNTMIHLKFRANMRKLLSNLLIDEKQKENNNECEFKF